MADSKLSALTALSPITADDLFYVVNDPGGSPASRKATVQTMLDLVETIWQADSKQLLFGAGADASIEYDGADFLFNSREVGSGHFRFQGGGRLQIEAPTGILSLISTDNNREFRLEMANFTFRIRNRQTNQSVLQVQYNDNDINLPLDGQKLQFGAGQDASIRYDGTDLIFNSRESGTGNYVFNGGAAFLLGGSLGSQQAIIEWNANLIGFGIGPSRRLTITDPSTTIHRRLIFQTPDSAIADGDLALSQTSFYLDETANNLVVKVKYADGTTVKTGTVPVA